LFCDQIRYFRLNTDELGLSTKSFWSLPLACAMLCGQVGTTESTRSTRQSETKEFRKDAAATKAIPADVGDATLWLDSAKWVEYSSEPGAIRFNHVNKHVLGWMLADKTGGIRTSAMKDMALRTSRRVDRNARISREERRIVNGREVLHLEIILTENSVPIRFAGYYHGGLKSNLQVVAYCAAAEFEGYQKEVNEFINGIEIREASSPEK
jgi:hypothetical protein